MHCPLHTCSPAGHEHVGVPVVGSGLQSEPPGHILPQAPQLLGSEVKSSHSLGLHSVVPCGHSGILHFLKAS
jgi:hypothetical protein